MSDVSNQIRSWWYQLPGVKWFAVWILAGACVYAISWAWEDRRPVGAFFETLVALMFYGLAVFGSFGAGIWAGISTAKKVESNIMGWIVGIAVMGSAVFSMNMVASAIPGVGWRFNLLFEDY